MKKLVFPDVPKKFEGKVPKGFVNDVHGWTFSRQEVLEAARAGKMLTMDIDMAGKGVCSLGCAHCFRRNPEFHKEKRVELGELLRHIAEAKKLGLKSVKIIGPGEPLEDPGLLPFLETLKGMDITVSIFTKGYIIGNDGLCMRMQGMDGRALAAKLKELGVSILLGTTSFSPELEDATVSKPGYHAARDKAILRLVEAGFADFVPGEATRLAFIMAPVKPDTIDEAFELYKYARERNIQPVLTPTMVAGKALAKLAELVPPGDQLLDLYVKINICAIEMGITTLEELERDGVAAYAGSACCNQVAVGVFMRGDGKVLRCPGDDVSIQGDLREESIGQIWEKSENKRKYAGMYNNGCPPKEGKCFPEGFFRDVLEQVLGHFKK